MPSVEIYTMSYCPYCIAAKRLLKKLGWQFNEIEITGKPKVKTTMVQRTQRRTVPQIFVNNQHIGGFDDFSAYVQEQKLL
ncbi:glutaredoxin 3 [Neptuniibacter sp. QD72_48]|uniref:glutaredoxin 3 n=1 Tax=unclassified Neptuniibacter TaxID=2630693 RepID=UPI0039F56834